MNVWELPFRDQGALTVVADGELPEWVAPDTEVWLAAAGDDIALHLGRSSITISGLGQSDQSELVRLAELPDLCPVWIHRVGRPSRADGRRPIFLNWLASPRSVHADGLLTIVVDDAALPDLQRLGGGDARTMTQALAFLQSQILAPPRPKDQLPDDTTESENTTEVEELDRSAAVNGRVYVSADPSDVTAFTVWGRALSADIRQQEPGRWVLDRVTASRARGGRTLVEVRGHFLVADQTTAALVMQEFKGDLLDHLDTQGTGAFLRLWNQYQNIEKEEVERRAVEVGSVEFHARRMTADDRWRFVLGGGANAFLGQVSVGDALVASTAPFDPRNPSEMPDDNPFIARIAALDLATSQVVLDAPRGKQPPQRGHLFLSLASDLTRFKRRDEARRTLSLESGVSPMPQLGLLIEGLPAPVRRVRRKSPLSTKVKVELGGSPTDRQTQAIDVALNTPDIALIQGPPGTGKSSVIAALQARLAELEGDDAHRGRTTLLTSFQHDAVEQLVAKTRTLGLPGIKIGRRFGTGEGDALPALDVWRDQVAGAIRRDTPTSGDVKHLQEAQTLLGKALLPMLPEERIDLLQRAGQLADGSTRLAIGAALSLEQRAPVVVEEARWMRRLRHWLKILGDSDESDAARLDAAMGAAKVLTDARRESGVAVPAQLLEAAEASNEAEVPGALLDDAAAAGWELLGAPEGVEDSERRPLANAQYDLVATVVAALAKPLKGTTTLADLAALKFADRLEHDADAVEHAATHYAAALAATCQQAASREMNSAMDGDTVFDNVIVDEAARANPLDLMIPLSMASRRVILVGDHRQLPQMLEPDVEAVIRRSVGDEAAERLQQSLFERLFNKLQSLEVETGQKRVVTLDTQFRMHPRLAEFVSTTFYSQDGGITSGASTAELDHPFAAHSGRVADWIDVPLRDGPEQRVGTGRARPSEARQVADVVLELAEHSSELSIGVITFYGAQRDLICDELHSRGLLAPRDGGGWKDTRPGGTAAAPLRVGTVDAFQGAEFDVVVLSTVRSNTHSCVSPEEQRRKWGFLTFPNRMCVATSRQRRLLLVVGDPDMAEGDAVEWAPELAALRQLCLSERTA